MGFFPWRSVPLYLANGAEAALPWRAMRRVVPLLAAALALAAPAGGESALLLPLPDAFGEIDAGTFDAAGQRIGAASLEVLRRPDGRVELRAESGIEGSAHSAVAAVMEVLPGGRALRLLSQRSESFDTRPGRAEGQILRRTSLAMTTGSYSGISARRQRPRMATRFRRTRGASPSSSTARLEASSHG